MILATNGHGEPPPSMMKAPIRHDRFPHPGPLPEGEGDQGCCGFHVNRQRGFTLLAGLFILIVLAALGAFMINISLMQHMTSAQDVQGARAYQAARAGIEWGMYQALRNSSCVASTSLTALGGLTDFGVTVTCAQSSFTEGANTVNVYDITATAATGALGSASYVERQLRATVSR